MALTNLPDTATLFDVVEKLKEKSALDESDKILLQTKMDEVPIDYPPESTLSDLIKVASLHLKEGGGTGGPVAWDEILNKPSAFPPEAHTHNADSLTPYHVGLVGSPVKSGYFDKLYLNGTELSPGGGDVTYEAVNTAITGKQINPSSVFSKGSGLNLLVEDDAIGQGFSLYKGADSTALLPFPANGKIDIGENISRINEGHFETLFVGGQEVVPGGGGGAPTYEQVNSVITDKEINPNSITTTDNLSLTGGLELIMNLSRSNGAGMKLGGSDGNVYLRKSNVSTTSFNLGVQNDPIDSGYFKKIFLNGEELVGGTGDVTYEVVNGVITGKKITPGEIESGYLTVRGRNAINLYVGDGAMRMENNNGVTNLSPFRETCSIGRPDKRMDQGHFTTMMVDGVDIGTELTSQKGSLIDSINAIKAVL